MLVEIKDVKQFDNEGYRRWFTDNYFDLIVWYEDDLVIGFQLCYDRGVKERSVTWVKNKGFTHNKIDDGELPGHTKMTPILVPDGIFNKEEIAQKFRKESKNIDAEIAEFVYSKLLTYP